MIEQPCYSRSLRAYKAISYSKKNSAKEFNDLAKKRSSEAALADKKSDWKQICQHLPQQIQSLLSKIHHLVTKSCNELCSESSAVADQLSTKILQILIHERIIMIDKNIKRVQELLGEADVKLSRSIIEAVSMIQTALSQDDIDFIDNLKNEPSNDVMSREFDIFSSEFQYKPASKFNDLKPLHDMMQTNSNNDIKFDYNDFTMIYTKSEEPAKEGEFDRKKFLASLRQCHAQYSSEMSFEEFGQLIENYLKNDNNLQAELFDVLGCDHIDFIEYIIKYRDKILPLFASQKAPKSITRTQERPQYGCQVIVQSEKEKQLLKQVRKEEKKLLKASNRFGEFADDSDDEIDTIALRTKRQQALQAMQTPILSTIKKTFVASAAPRESYPYVFDSQLKSKTTTGFVSGHKLILPEDVVRKDTNLCEEVAIPVSKTSLEDLNFKSVKISSLDEIGQMAFEGINTLNRIQSIVFNAAYNSNENLLICAPTGAGKTNVALLTVIHQLKLHIDNGVLKRNEFKIIYIAPMKALAAEMTANFNKRLASLGVAVKELTGDMQLTKREIQQTQMIVTTPEKWDVVTRKGTGDIALTSIVKLLIIDEVHLLHGDRGPVVEALVARTLRQVESSQSMIRIVGLSATLPNYVDVARFLRVNPYKGLFYFDHRFRPVPLSQTFIGIKARQPMQQIHDMDLVCYNQVVDMVKKGHQVMVFVHARNATIRTATKLKELAQQNDTINVFKPDPSNAKLTQRSFNNSRNKYLGELFAYGFSVHHAGMLRSDRNLVEKAFGQGAIKVLVCTSTLAWGVNLPAHAVIIRGTEIYDSKHGSFIDLGILDVLQIFGRAGRPQFDTSGHAVIITAHNKLSHYLSLLTNQFPIESSFITYLADNLNAEIALGTISNVEEAVEWLSYTYLYVRMRLNPMAYGMLYQQVIEDPNLDKKRKELIDTAAKSLDKARMIRYNVRTGDLNSTDLGRTSSHYYLKYDTVEIFNELSKPIMTEADILGMLTRAQEFEQLKVRDDEMDELDDLTKDYCELVAHGGTENVHGKVNILVQTYLSRGKLSSFSLISDQAYIIQNAIRISRALFEVMLRQNNAIMAGRLLNLAKMLEAQQWDHVTPLRQFFCLGHDIIEKIDQRNLTIDKLKEMHVREIGDMLRNQKSADLVKKCCSEFPALSMYASIQPITRTVLRIRLRIQPEFRWNDHVHGKSSEAFWIWIEDTDNNFIYHHEYFLLTKKMAYSGDEQEIVMTIPLQEPHPAQYLIKATSDRWLGCEYVLSLGLHNLVLPETYPPHTDLLELQPLPVTVLKDESFQSLYKFTHFNPIQTQIFHCLYHTDCNVLLGAPTGSGKTIAAEIAMFRVFKNYPKQKVVYIAPLKALVRERMRDWKIRLEQKLGKKVCELTGDVSPDIRQIAQADVIVTTPEKWDGISRSWQTRNYVREVVLIIIDEIHLLGEDRGPVLEVIVSRTNFIASHTKRTLRIIGLSTALANAVDLANWLGIKKMGLYNFRPSVRPVPLEVHISGFPGKHYCPRMATMNRPTFQAIRQHAPTSPSLVFVSSRRQTRLTALDLIAYLAAEDNPKQWLHMPEQEMDNILTNIKDVNLKLTLAFGIGLHHAGLQDKDRETVEELFVNNKIQVLITTATLAWGVNFPAHLVVIKGTEYYDGKVKRYVDMPITDVLQMMGRAGRPQFDDSGVAVVLVHDIKKNFYKKFLYEPFPVESNLLEVLPDHINAEIVAGTIGTKQQFLDYLTWTYFFRRLMKNPRYYNLESLDTLDINSYLSNLVDCTLKVLIDCQCVAFDEELQSLYALAHGKIASFYYLSHQTVGMFTKVLKDNLTLVECLKILCDAHEYSELPVRHNEDLLNEELSKSCRYPGEKLTFDSPNTKAFLLFQAHFSRLPLPSTDYTTDLKSILDQAIRILQAMIDIVAENGWLSSTLRMIQLMQMIIRARWIDESALTTLPHVHKEDLSLFDKSPKSLPGFCAFAGNYSRLAKVFDRKFSESQIRDIHQVAKTLPVIDIQFKIQLTDETDGIKVIDKPMKPDDCIYIYAGHVYTLLIEMKRKNSPGNIKSFTTTFHKSKDEGWFAVLGDERSELWALKRIPSIQTYGKTHQLQFTAPELPGKTRLFFYLMSDCYLGLDQQYEINININ
ncbi:activating signal cointegrator 1 complex subunit 3 [Microplitis demolitor]|uniref:activating signal cointegrator 1 complex subunit 3 n=1 Tax=Microplitis demolitor TaxID=69319 RepID=UPI0004CD4801|nr:activating signal cointegrator 1 complex subunit 3 [Microplitis demolitor]